jgi:isochorismate synthase
LVGEIQREIASGRFEKAVLARRAIYRLDTAPDAGAVLNRLALTAPDCTRFAVQRQGRVFLGATPEWLIRKRGSQVASEAMAGSRSSRDADAEARLLASSKDLNEHRPVLEELLRTLRPLCSELSVPDSPSVRHLRDLLHLHTPVKGTLETELHVLDLVERLHPTPAVGGTPRVQALDWLSAHETESRGWYASPVGWVDANGDGEFVVALRSAMIVDTLAHLYAGAGIVAESDADAEYEETRLKLASMVRALGVA